MTGGGKTTTTSQLQIPQWMSDAGKSTFDAASSAAAANPITAYKGPLAAGTNANLDQASATARTTAGTGQPDLEQARAYTGQAATTPTGRVSAPTFDAAAAARYADPYTQQVQQNTLAEMARQNSMQNQGLRDSSQGSKAYGGTREAVLEAEQAKGQNRNMLDYLAQSNGDAFNDAYSKFAGDRSATMSAEGTNAGLDQSDLMRIMQAGGQAAGIGTTAAGINSGAIDNLAKTGALEQSTQQNQDEANYQEFLRMQDAPMQRYMQLMGLLSGTPSDKTTTDTTKQKTSLLSQLAGGAALAGAAFSDRRLKRDIVRVGSYRILGTTVGIYRFRYLWELPFWPQHIGFMADEVKAVMPWAIRRTFGFDTVDYSAIYTKGA